MKDAQIRELLAKGVTNTFNFDPKMKSEITRSEMDAMIRDLKGHLLKKKMVTVIVVKG